MYQNEYAKDTRNYEAERMTVPDRTENASKLPLAEQNKAVGGLHDVIDQLELKLSAVLAPAYPEEQEILADTTRSGSPLHNELMSNNQIISRASQRIRNLIERIEC